MQRIRASTSISGGAALRRGAVFVVLAMSIALNLAAGSFSSFIHVHENEHEHEHATANHDHGDHHNDHQDGHAANRHHMTDTSLAAHGPTEGGAQNNFADCEGDCGGVLHEHHCCVVLALLQPSQLMIDAQTGVWNPSVPSFELTGPRTTFERPPRA